MDQEMFDHHVSFARDLLLGHPKDGETLQTGVGVFKDDRPYMWAFPDMTPESGYAPRDRLLQVAVPIIRGAEPDFLLIVQEVFAVGGNAAERLKEIDGKKVAVKRNGEQWSTGDMEYAREHNTEDAPDVVDELMVSYYDRAGESGVYSQTFERKDDQIVWLGEPRTFISDGELNQFTGAVPETIAEAFSQPTIRQSMTNLLGLEEELPAADWLARFAMEPGTTQTLTEAVTWAGEHPEEAYANMLCSLIKSMLAPLRCGIGLPVYGDHLEVLEVFRKSLAAPGIDMTEIRIPAEEK